jgi:glycosyltransferase involved in cell wall biosynthesis
MQLRDTLVSIGLPVRNGVRTLETAVRSVLAQDHERLELVISDNASTDGTEALCRELAATDSRIVYHRQPQDVGLVHNFVQTMRLANGTFFQPMGDDDWLAPRYVSRCLEAFTDDSRLILVTTQINYTRPDGTTYTYPYCGTTLRSNDPIERLDEITSYLADGMPIDPLYGLMRRAPVATIARQKMIREDEVYAAKLALAGPWGHVPQVLMHRHLKYERLTVLARRLGVPVWQAYVPTALQCREMLRWIHNGDFTPLQRRRARVAVARMYVRRHYLTLTRRVRKLVQLFGKCSESPTL